MRVRLLGSLAALALVGAACFSLGRRHPPNAEQFYVSRRHVEPLALALRLHSRHRGAMETAEEDAAPAGRLVIEIDETDTLYRVQVYDASPATTGGDLTYTFRKRDHKLMGIIAGQ